MNSKLVSVLLASFLSVGAHAAAVPFSNGSFETSNLTADDYKYSYTGAIADAWSFAGYAGLISNSVSGANTAWGASASTGTNFAFVQDYYGGGGSLFQSFSVASSGALSLSFDLSARSGSAQNLSVLIDGTAVWSGTASNTTWQAITTSPVSLSAGDHMITFASSVPLVAGDNTAFIDNVALTPLAAVPEPETYAMLLAGLGMMGFIAKRRNSRQG